MKSLLLSVLFVMQGSASGDLPVLAASEGYNTLSEASGPPYRTYAIHAGLGVVLDASSYRFTAREAESVNGVHLARGKAIYRGGELQLEGIAAIYGREWTVGSGPCVLSSSTLKPIYGSPAFAPLRAGEVLAVGWALQPSRHDRRGFRSPMGGKGRGQVTDAAEQADAADEAQGGTRTAS